LNELDTDKEAAGAAAAAISAHESDTTAHPASSIVFTPVGTIAATDAQTAIAEVATDAAAALSSHVAAADPHTGYLVIAPGTSARNTINPSADVITLIVNAFITQTAKLASFRSALAAENFY
ncbi:MAG: hypothetical protein VW405_09015, partial [Rhodospirillaceae bacterium]